jgi:hypothetical protein
VDGSIARVESEGAVEGRHQIVTEVCRFVVGWNCHDCFVLRNYFPADDRVS